MKSQIIKFESLFAKKTDRMGYIEHKVTIYKVLKIH